MKTKLILEAIVFCLVMIGVGAFLGAKLGPLGVFGAWVFGAISGAMYAWARADDWLRNL